MQTSGESCREIANVLCRRTGWAEPKRYPSSHAHAIGRIDGYRLALPIATAFAGNDVRRFLAKA